MSFPKKQTAYPNHRASFFECYKVIVGHTHTYLTKIGIVGEIILS